MIWTASSSHTLPDARYLRFHGWREPHTSPLDGVHRDLGARMVAFGGWDMPVSYPAGILAEHAAFRGRSALLEQHRNGLERRLRGLVLDGRRLTREGQAVIRDGTSVAELTSDNFSPTLGHGIAMAFLPVDLVPGDVVALDQRGTEVAATVVATPFVGG